MTHSYPHRRSADLGGAASKTERPDWMAFMVGARARKKRGSGRGRRDERGNPVRFDDRPEVTDDPAIAKSRGTEQHHRLAEHRGAERKHEHAADKEQWHAKPDHLIFLGAQHRPRDPTPPPPPPPPEARRPRTHRG